MSEKERTISTEIDLKYQMPEGAEEYITSINPRGIQIHPKIWGLNNSSYLELDGSSLKINDITNTLLAGFDSTSISIGKLTSGHTIINSDGLQVYDSQNQKVLDTTLNGIKLYKANSLRVAVTNGGLDIYGNDGTTKIASYGNITVIGDENQAHLEVKQSEIRLLGTIENENPTVLSIKQYGLEFTSENQKMEMLFAREEVIIPDDPTEYRGPSFFVNLPTSMTTSAGSNIKNIYLKCGSDAVPNQITMRTRKYKSGTSNFVDAIQTFETGSKYLEISNRGRLTYSSDSVSSYFSIYNEGTVEQLRIGSSLNQTTQQTANRGIWSPNTNRWLIRETADGLDNIYVGSLDLSDASSARNSIKASGKISIQYKDIALGSIAANTYKSGETSFSPTDYYYGRCVVGWYFSGTNTSLLIVNRIFYNQTDEYIGWGVRNIHSSAVSGTLRVFVLCTYDGE